MSQTSTIEKTDQSLWTLNIERTFDAPVKDVFKAWTDPDQLKQWFCNDCSGNFCVEKEGEINVTVCCEDSGSMNLNGKYIEIIENEKLVFTWKWLSSPLSEIGETLVTVDFIALGEKTKLILTHEGFNNKEFRDQHNSGWDVALNRIEEFI